ncbi:MAG: formate--tetrahydrofolate ligase, partial [Nanoarchaeota archaeon]
DINMLFTGDIHSVTTSCNLLSALIDNSINNDNPLNLDIDNIIWRRSIDMNDKSLRNVLINSGNKDIVNHKSFSQRNFCDPPISPTRKFPKDFLVGDIINHETKRIEHFDITSASEVMAILSLTLNYSELKSRLGKIIIGFTKERQAIYSESLKIHNAMAAVLKNAIHPNLVQSIENVPAFVHGGAFGNVAHGCNSLVATKMALGLADYVITEAGFGADLGAEKFFDIKCRVGNLNPSAVVIVVTVKALKMHGQGIELSAIERGFENLEKQIENVRKFNMEPLVAINKFQEDREEEHNIIIRKCNDLSVSAFVIDVYLNGGNGALEIAEKLITVCDTERELRFLYDVGDSIEQKVGVITREMFGARNVNYSTNAKEDIRLIETNNLDKLPICMAKTQKSLSDNPNLVGRPKDFDVTVTKVRVSAGAGFIVVYLGDILTMPGLPKIPSALNIDIDKEGRIIGLF